MNWKYHRKYYIRVLHKQYDSLEKTFSLHIYLVLQANICWATCNQVAELLDVLTEGCGRTALWLQVHPQFDMPA